MNPKFESPLPSLYNRTSSVQNGMDCYRYYSSDLSIWLSIDPMSDKYPSLSPYAYCADNPVKLVDPDGEDWYEAEDKSIQWTTCKSQDALNKVGKKGTYLGEAFVHFEGSVNEKLGKNNLLGGIDPDGTKGYPAERDDYGNPAKVTIYGLHGDIQEYRGLTMSSDPEKYSAVEDGDYRAKYDDMDGLYQNGYRISNLDNTLKIPTRGGEVNKNVRGNGKFMTGIFLHRTNKSGFAGDPVSKGCLVIDGRQWNGVKTQLEKSEKIYLRVTRKD